MRALFALLLAFGFQSILAASSSRLFEQWHHTAWYANSGAPAEVWAIAQTRDGWLWFGGASGLHRFDGVTFERVPTDVSDPNRLQPVSSFLALESGALLIGYVHGGASLLKDGTFTHYTAQSGLGTETIYSFEHDTDGSLWAATRSGLMHLDGARWERADHEWGFPDGVASDIALDANGTLWGAAISGVFRLQRETRRFERVASTSEAPWFLRSPDGRVWYVDVDVAHALSAVAEHKPVKSTNSRACYLALFGADGSLWALTGNGIGYRPVQEAGPTLTRMQLPAPHPSALSKAIEAEGEKTVMEDREGNVWISTISGIHRFRRTNVVPLITDGLSGVLMPALLADPQNGVWMVSRNNLTNSLQTDGVWKFDERLTPMQRQDIPWASAIQLAHDGRIWVAGERLWRHDGQRFSEGPVLPPPVQGQIVQSITDDGGGNLWLSVNGVGLFRYRENTWERNGGLSQLPTDPPYFQTRDKDGRIWLGYIDNTVVAVDNDHVTKFLAADGVGLGAVTSISVGRYTLAAGERGLAMLLDGKFRKLTTGDALALQGVRGLVETPEGDVWLNGSRGAVRILASALLKAAANGGSDNNVAVDLFDQSDGYPGAGAAATMMPQPRMAMATDGRIWLSGMAGVAWIDPPSIRRNDVAPVVVARALTANDHRHEASTAAHLTPGTRNVQIDYTALSFTLPERLQFRYRLVGLDDVWVEAGTRRQAFYTNLGPGAYRFEVMAANENGVWSAAPAKLEFSIPPTFVQTKAFLALCAAALVVLAMVLYRARVRQIMTRQQNQLEERLAERERIARELHDTLLQSTQGLILHVQTAIDRIDPTHPARKMLEDTLDRADAVVAEGRDRVRDLRVATKPELTQLIAAAGAEFAREHGTAFSATVEGKARHIAPHVCDEAYRVGREALLNAFTHGQARSIETRISFDVHRLRLLVRDDGRGMDAGQLEDGATPGHWGIIGMRERAQRIGAQFDLRSRPGAGTEIELCIPASIAYADQRKPALWARRRGARP